MTPSFLFRRAAFFNSRKRLFCVLPFFLSTLQTATELIRCNARNDPQRLDHDSSTPPQQPHIPPLTPHTFVFFHNPFSVHPHITHATREHVTITSPASLCLPRSRFPHITPRLPPYHRYRPHPSCRAAAAVLSRFTDANTQCDARNPQHEHVAHRRGMARLSCYPGSAVAAADVCEPTCCHAVCLGFPLRPGFFAGRA